MATQFEVLLPLGTEQGLERAAHALDVIDRCEAQLTVYRDDSDVSALNRRAAQETVEVHPDLFELLELSARIHRETAGAFDPTAGALIKTWGFFRGPRRVPSKEERIAACRLVGMNLVALQAECRTVRFLRPGLELNFGSIGKGFALDRAATCLGGGPALLQGGRSSILALGALPGSDRGWPVQIDHPWHRNRKLALLHLRNQALATSAATFQHLEWQGRKLGHILDPRTGWPAEQMASVSVVAPTAAEADALATAFFILGVAPARAYCDAHPEVGAILLPAEPRGAPIAVGLPVRVFQSRVGRAERGPPTPPVGLAPLDPPYEKPNFERP
jgi:thiamine biosynthesis lipoprotein